MSTYIQFNQPIVAQIGWVILAVPHLIFSFTLYIDSVMSWQHIPCHAFKTLLKRFRLYIEIGNPVYPVEQRGPSFMLALCTMFTAPPPRPAPLLYRCSIGAGSRDKPVVFSPAWKYQDRHQILSSWVLLSSFNFPTLLALLTCTHF